MPQLQLSMEVLDLEVCHFVEYRPYNGEFEPMEMQVTVVKRDRGWFDRYLPVMQKFISDLENFKIEYEIYLKTILPSDDKEKKEPRRKKRKFDNFAIEEYDDLRNKNLGFMEIM